MDASAFNTSVVNVAKSRGAQAVILRDVQTYVAGSTSFGTGFSSGNATAIRSGQTVNTTGTGYSSGYGMNVPMHESQGLVTFIRFKGATPVLPAEPVTKTDPSLVPPNQRK